MGSRIVTTETNRVGSWVLRRAGNPYIPDVSQAIGLEREGSLVAGVVFEGWNGVCSRVHFAVDDKAYLTRQFLWFIGHYGFDQLGAKKLIVFIDIDNKGSLRITKRMGFEEVTVLEGVTKSGGLVIKTLTKEQYKYMRLNPNAIPRRI